MKKDKKIIIIYSILFVIIEFAIIYKFILLENIGGQCWINCIFDSLCREQNTICQKSRNLHNLFMKLDILFRIIPLTMPIISILCLKKDNNKKRKIILYFIAFIIWEILIWGTYVFGHIALTPIH